MSCGLNFPALFRRAAEFVDKILRRTKPRELPGGQPTKFDLVINLKTANALGLTISSGRLHAALGRLLAAVLDGGRAAGAAIIVAGRPSRAPLPCPAAAGRLARPRAEHLPGQAVVKWAWS